MLRGNRPSLGAVGVLCGYACVAAWACSSAHTGSGSEQAGGGSSSSSGAGEASAQAGTVGLPATGGASAGSSGGAGNSSTRGGRAATGDAGASLASGGDDSAGAGASGSAADGVRSIFYLDVQGRVLTFDEDAPSARTLVRSAGQGPDGIAVDTAGGHVFWTTMGVPADDDGSLRRANLDGSNVTTIVPAGGTYTPKQLRLDEAGQKLYWSDREGMRIQRAALDGSEVETLVTVAAGATARKDAANWCVGLALDLEHGFVYWTQKGPDNGMVGSIHRAHLELPAGETDTTRSDIELLFDNLPEPVDLDVDVASGYLYWSDRGDDTISRGPIEVPGGKSAATRTDREILVRGVPEAIGVTLDLERGHLYFTSGQNGRVGRANLDGSGALDLIAGTGALTGIAVVQLPNR